MAYNADKELKEFFEERKNIYKALCEERKLDEVEENARNREKEIDAAIDKALEPYSEKITMETLRHQTLLDSMNIRTKEVSTSNPVDRTTYFSTVYFKDSDVLYSHHSSIGDHYVNNYDVSYKDAKGKEQKFNDVNKALESLAAEKPVVKYLKLKESLSALDTSDKKAVKIQSKIDKLLSNSLVKDYLRLEQAKKVLDDEKKVNLAKKEYDAKRSELNKAAVFQRVDCYSEASKLRKEIDNDSENIKNMKIAEIFYNDIENNPKQGISMATRIKQFANRPITGYVKEPELIEYMFEYQLAQRLSGENLDNLSQQDKILIFREADRLNNAINIQHLMKAHNELDYKKLIEMMIYAVQGDNLSRKEKVDLLIDVVKLRDEFEVGLGRDSALIGLSDELETMRLS